MMKRYSNRFLGLAMLAGAGVGIACGSLVFNQQLRHRIGRKMRRIGRACWYQGAELKETAEELLEKGGRNLKDVRDTGRRMYQRLAG